MDDGGGSLTVDGTVAVTEPVSVDDNGSTLSVDDGGGSLTVDGTVAVSGAVDTELPAGDNLGSTTAYKTSSPIVGAQLMIADGANHVPVPNMSDADGTGTNGNHMGTMAKLRMFNGTSWDRARGDTTNGLDVDVTRVGGTVTAKETRAATVAHTQVSDTASSTTILASNANRLKATITNDSTARLYLRLEAAAASTTAYTVSLAQHETWEENTYTGEIRGIWATDPNAGAARVAEFTA